MTETDNPTQGMDRQTVDWPKMVANAIMSLPAVSYGMGWWGFEVTAILYLLLILLAVVDQD